MTTRWMTPPQVASQLGIKSDAVRVLIRSGELRAVDLAGKGSRRPRYKIDPSDLKIFLESRQVRPPAARATRRRRKQLDIIAFF